MTAVPDHSSPALAQVTLPRLLGALSDPTRPGSASSALLSDGAERAWGELRAPIAKSTSPTTCRC